MKKILCALLAALMLVFTAAAEESSETEELQIVGIVEESTAELSPTIAPSPTPAATPALEGVRLGFEDGFALELPQGWLYHPVTEEMAAQGVTYCLSNAAEDGWLYVQIWDTDCADMDALKALIDRTAQPQTSGVYDFGGNDFVIYDLTEGDVSCCATLFDGSVLNLVFSPQTDADFMAVVAQILNTFERISF